MNMSIFLSFFAIICVYTINSHNVVGHTYNVQGNYISLNSNEMEIGDCSNPNEEDLLYFGNNSLPARSSVDSAVSFSTTFSTRGGEVIYCVIIKGNDNTAVTITSGGVNTNSVSFVQKCNIGQSAQALLYVYGR